jgi:hypothetical protein
MDPFHSGNVVVQRVARLPNFSPSRIKEWMNERMSQRNYVRETYVLVRAMDDFFFQLWIFKKSQTHAGLAQ